MLLRKFYLHIILLSALILTGCSDSGSNFREAHGMVWNTTYNITYRSHLNLEDSIIQELEDVGRALNVFDTTSIVSRVNVNISYPVNDSFTKVYNMARRVSRLSHGAFDPTLGPLIKAWGFGPGHHATSDTLRIDSILGFTGISRTRLSNDTLYKEDIRTGFNFSAIAKGYGCDRVAEMLHRNGCDDFIVEIGGEIVASGESPSGRKWRISVDRPVLGAGADSRDSQAIIAITDMGFATSGNYRNFHSSNGSIYGHTISATTGRPVRTDVISASVAAPSAMEADAMATACMALGSKKALALCDSLRLPVMLVLGDSSVVMSNPFKILIKEASAPGNTTRN